MMTKRTLTLLTFLTAWSGCISLSVIPSRNPILISEQYHVDSRSLYFLATLFIAGSLTYFPLTHIFMHTVPGIMDSQLWARLNRTSVNHVQCAKTSDWYNIWLSIEQLVYPVEECTSDNMM